MEEQAPVALPAPMVHHFYELAVIPNQYHGILAHTNFVKVVGPGQGTVSIRFPTMASCTAYFSGQTTTIYPVFDGFIRDVTAEVVGERVDDSVFFVRRRDRNLWLNNFGLAALEAEIGAAIPPPPPPPVLANGFYRIVGPIDYEPITNLLIHTALLLVVKAEEKEIGEGRVSLTFPSARSYAKHFMGLGINPLPECDFSLDVDTDSVFHALQKLTDDEELELFAAGGDDPDTWLTNDGLVKVEQLMEGLNQAG